MYLNPPSSSSQRTSVSLFFTSYLNLAISFKLHPLNNDFVQYIPHAPKQLSTLRLGEVSVWDKITQGFVIKRYEQRKTKRNGQMIMGLQSLTLKYISRVFFSKILLKISKVMWDFIVWVKKRVKHTKTSQQCILQVIS